MSRGLIVVVGLIYSYIAVESILAGKIGLSVMFAGYAFANVGAWMLAE